MPRKTQSKQIPGNASNWRWRVSFEYVAGVLIIHQRHTKPLARGERLVESVSLTRTQQKGLRKFMDAVAR